VLSPEHAEVFAIKEKLTDFGACAASMTGSGPSVFGLFTTQEAAQNACDALKKEYRGTFLCEFV